MCNPLIAVRQMPHTMVIVKNVRAPSFSIILASDAACSELPPATICFATKNDRVANQRGDDEREPDERSIERADNERETNVAREHRHDDVECEPNHRNDRDCVDGALA